MSTEPHITDNQGGTPSPTRSGSGSAPSHLGDTLRWAFELDASPTLAGATWLTREIVPGARDPFDAIVATTTTLDALEQLKGAYKMLRTAGTTTAERSLAARLYAATIAAALVRHGKLITSQRGEALLRAFTDLESDATMPEAIRSIASQALTAARRT
ncbi:MAG: hypothetical protein LW806_12245 [Planctomycetaceae bacterium]|jgi:hypothetical protein|nr:hypothetical protein [Planctomycetaceae bacterium]